MKLKLGVFSILLVVSIAMAKDSPIKVSTVTDGSPSSSDVVAVFRQKLAAHANLFALVENSNASAGIVFQLNCLGREGKDQPYACFYTSHYASGFGKSLMGGGINVTRTAQDMADGFVASFAQDITENYNGAIRTTDVERLEACLFLTETSCSIPEALQPDLKLKSINLSQYLQKGGLDKTKPGIPK